MGHETTPAPAGDGDRSARRLWPIIVVLVLLMRVGVLVGSQRWLYWDECIIGLAGLDVLYGHPHVYFPGSAYAGGVFFETLILAGLYLIFGLSAWAVKLYALAVSMATLVVIGLFVRRVWGWSAANWSCLLWATAPGLAIFALQVRGGYIEIQLLIAAALYLFHRSVLRPGGRPGHFIGLGVALGLSYFCFPATLPLLPALAVVAFAWDKRFWLRRGFRLTVLGLMVGLGPMMVYDLTHDFAHLRWAFSTHGHPAGPELWQRYGRMVTYDLPSFYAPPVDDFYHPVQWWSWLLGGLTAVLAGGWVWQVRSEPGAVLRRLLRGSSKRAPWPAGLQTAMLLYVAVFLLVYPFGPGSGTAPRYFVSLYPILAVGMGVGLADRLRHASTPQGRVLAAVGATLVGGGLLVNVHLMDLPGLRTVLGAPKLVEAGVATRPDGIISLRDWLARHGIRNVYAHPIIKWKLIFYSREKILASALYSNAPDDWKRLRYYLDVLGKRVYEQGERYAFVMHRDLGYEGTTRGAYWRFLSSTLRAQGVNWRETVVGDYRVLHDFTGPAVRILQAKRSPLGSLPFGG